MTSPQRIKCATTVVLQDITDSLLDFRSLSKDETYYKISTLPTDFIRQVCSQFDSDIWKYLAIPEQKIPAAFMTVKAIVEPKVSNSNKAIKAAGYIINPWMASAKEQLLDSNEQKASKLVANNATAMALTIFEELHRSGVSQDDIEKSVFNFHSSYTEANKLKTKKLELIEDSIALLILKENAKDYAQDSFEEVSERAKDAAVKAKGIFKGFF